MRTAAVLFVCGLALGTYMLDASSNDRLPAGWSIGGEAPKLYTADLDMSDSPSGKGALVLRRTETSHPYGSARLSQSIPVALYAGKRVRVSMRVRFKDTEPMGGAVFIGTDRSSHLQALEFGDGWNLYQANLTLPSTAKQLDIGVGLNGPGVAGVDGIDLQVLGDAPPEQHGVSIQDPKLNGNSANKGSL